MIIHLPIWKKIQWIEEKFTVVLLSAKCGENTYYLLLQELEFPHPKIAE
jgi:hypothetical protein